MLGTGAAWGPPDWGVNQDPRDPPSILGWLAWRWQIRVVIVISMSLADSRIPRVQ